MKSNKKSIIIIGASTIYVSGLASVFSDTGYQCLQYRSLDAFKRDRIADLSVYRFIVFIEQSDGYAKTKGICTEIKNLFPGALICAAYVNTVIALNKIIRGKQFHCLFHIGIAESIIKKLVHSPKTDCVLYCETTAQMMLLEFTENSMPDDHQPPLGLALTHNQCVVLKKLIDEKLLHLQYNGARSTIPYHESHLNDTLLYSFNSIYLKIVLKIN